MASQKNLVYLQNKETGEIYHTRKNKKLVERKLKYKKYSRKLQKHVWFEEVKKPQKIKKKTQGGKATKKAKKVETKAEKAEPKKEAKPAKIKAKKKETTKKKEDK